MSFSLKNIISIRDFKKSDVDYILKLAEEMEPIARSEQVSHKKDGKLLGVMFYEPSTRTRLSFETAMKRLGGDVVGFNQKQGTSVQKGEVLYDTAQIISQYSDAIVLRHDMEGAARFISNKVDIPVINAGDGAGQHPTQTLLDLYTIKRTRGDLSNLKIALVGDLKYGRTVHSLVYALAMFKAEIVFISPKELQMPPEILKDLEKLNCKFTIKESLLENIEDVDVIYMTRIQKERFPDPKEYLKVKGRYALTAKNLENSNSILMHPLPRVDEISFDVDNLSNAMYFKQAFYGVPIRMALLDSIIK
ncbi:aspartate carbamoyltransferase [Methanosphaera sp. WGK6]|uniref:aspartate carbamoyltransferase n=1 Tax=Methanosphaera sp. WGK6 TaxID=1561964 RepID=UPI00084C993A|nr:aspartate carbamoyltransferase [Methanosphaera sp. WGK6]OED30804.1 aspartate carbamoyltransferase [Methanosphaera sp. WGK6]